MTPEQKQQAQQAIEGWQSVRNDDPMKPAGDVLAALLQEMIAAPEPEPVAYATGYYAGCLSIATIDGRVLPAGTALYAAPPHQSEHHLEMVNTPAPSVPVEPMENIALNEWLDKTEWVQKEINTFPVSSLGMHRADVMRMEIERLREMLSAAPTPAEPPADLDAPEFSDGCEKEGFPGGCARMGCCKQLPATANPARTSSSQIEPPADLVRDSVASEPVGYLYTNLQSGEYHVSDADDDYRGPERALWCIEPVYRGGKGQS